MRAAVWIMTLAGTAGLAFAAQAADYAGHRQHRHAHVAGVIGACVKTRVETVGGPAGTATPVIGYRDGVVQAFDGGSLGHAETKLGDPIQLCLISFTRDCGEDEVRGRTYATGNLRTGATWTLPDIRSSCAVR